jgi:hypothetical protein
MATVALTPAEFNAIRIEAALAAWRRQPPTRPQEASGPSSKPRGNTNIPGPRETPSADPHKQRGFETGKDDGATVRRRPDPRRGGRPRQYATVADKNRAASRAYRARRRTGAPR